MPNYYVERTDKDGVFSHYRVRAAYPMSSLTDYYYTITAAIKACDEANKPRPKYTYTKVYPCE